MTNTPRSSRAQWAWTAGALATLLISGALTAVALAPSTPAAYTTVNEGVDGAGHCHNGNPAVNCNQYDGKPYVWMNGGPSGLADGTYFFAVLDPGGQANPNDGTPKNLSSPNDAYTNRTFTVASGVVSYAGTHDLDTNKIRLLPYNDTTNNGGVYIMAICSLGSGYPIAPSKCKYDAFKVRAGSPDDPGVTATKDVNPSFTRTYTWDLTKSVDKTYVRQAGGNATFNYTVTATRSTAVDSAFKLTGTIAVVNGAATAVASDLVVSDTPSFDQSGPSAVCKIFNPPGYGTPGVEYDNLADLAGGAELDFPYSCTLADATATTSGVNAAGVDWTNPDASSDSTVAPPASFDFADASPTVVDVCTTVTDTVKGSLGIPCSTISYTYSRTIAVGHGCVDYPNTATSTTNTTGTTKTAYVKVTVCGPIRTGALTIGFWQNKNGQAIITGEAKTGVCGSGTFLRTYTPFQDLSATATCAQVATYVTNIIKAASAAGTAMNPMLKAQMLATALDTYFSSAALGGNKIGAPAPLGGVAIDLTQVNASPGSGNYVNASVAFGGATSLTVSQILAYAASQSNAGGTIWYGQVKNTQELAKDVFDAINNEVAFGP